MRMAFMRSALFGAGMLETVVCVCLVAEVTVYRLHPVLLRNRLLLLGGAWTLQHFVTLRASLTLGPAPHSGNLGASTEPSHPQPPSGRTTPKARTGVKRRGAFLPAASSESGLL